MRKFSTNEDVQVKILYNSTILAVIILREKRNQWSHDNLSQMRLKYSIITKIMTQLCKIRYFLKWFLHPQPNSRTHFRNTLQKHQTYKKITFQVLILTASWTPIRTLQNLFLLLERVSPRRSNHWAQVFFLKYKSKFETWIGEKKKNNKKKKMLQS